MFSKLKCPVLGAIFCLAAHLLSAQTQKTLPLDVQHHIEKVTSCLPARVVVKDDLHPCTTLTDGMTQLHIPGVSIVVIHSGSIEWARGFGVKQLGGAPVSEDTLFQAGSISKPLAAMAALHQVQDKKLSLDADVNTELVTWKVSPSPVSNGKVVTLRELLTHTAGLTVHGFPGYSMNDPVPTLIQVLDGQKPANTAAIRIESEPGMRWNYSGGGYILTQHRFAIRAPKPPCPELKNVPSRRSSEPGHANRHQQRVSRRSHAPQLTLKLPEALY